MPAPLQEQSGLATLASRLLRTVVGTLLNRFELLAVEWQEERARLSELVAWTLAFAFLGLMGMLLLTATIVLLFPADLRVYVTAAFALLYWLGAVAAWFGLRALLKREPFPESLDQARKDRIWLDSLK